MIRFLLNYMMYEDLDLEDEQDFRLQIISDETKTTNNKTENKM